MFRGRVIILFFLVSMCKENRADFWCSNDVFESLIQCLLKTHLQFTSLAIPLKNGFPRGWRVKSCFLV